MQAYKPSNQQPPPSTHDDESSVYRHSSHYLRQQMSTAQMLRELLQIVMRELIQNMNTFSQMMLKSKGRNKVFALAQYLVDLYIKTMSHSDKYRALIKQDLIESVRVSKIVKKNISSGRKVFKLMKFIDEYNSFKALYLEINEGADEGKKTSKSTTQLIKVLALLKTLFGIFYYLFDNLVWFANMGAINKDIIENQLGWRYVKDMFALFKTTCCVLKSIIKLTLSYRKTLLIEKKLFKADEKKSIVIADHQDVTLLAFQLLHQRQKTTMSKLSTFGSFLRIIQLFHRLKFQFARNNYHPIFIVLCRIISLLISLFKVWIEVQTQRHITTRSSHCIIDQKQMTSGKITLKEINKLKKFIALSNIQKHNL